MTRTTPNPRIERDPARASAGRYDLIAVGGGFFGVCVALEAAQRGLRVLLLERDDFGGATSWNSLRIVHGGLRYLQHMDLSRYRESVAERRWFMRHFPDLVKPLECLMPLYGDGMRKPSVFRAAMLMNDTLSARRNVGVPPQNHLPTGSMLSPDEAVGVFPRVDRDGLRAVARWWDGRMTCSPRVVIEIARWACALGATALNYVAARGLIVENGRVAGVEAVDRVTGDSVAFRAPIVINGAGPWCREVAAAFDRDHRDLFPPSLAFNLLIDHPPLSRAAVALTPRRPGARTYFVLPWDGRLFAGTYHTRWDDPTRPAEASEAQIAEFLADLCAAVPGLTLSPAQVVRVFAGILPAAREGPDHTAHRSTFVDHAERGGPAGLFSTAVVKLTTARLEAERALRRALPMLPESRHAPRPTPAAAIPTDWPGPDGAPAAAIAAIVEEEAVVYRDDLLLRRTDWGVTPRGHAEASALLRDRFGWHADRFPDTPAPAHHA